MWSCGRRRGSTWTARSSSPRCARSNSTAARSAFARGWPMRRSRRRRRPRTCRRARAVIRVTERPVENRFFYAADAPITEKIEATARTLYGADGVDYASLAKERIKLFSELGYHTLALNMAKTHLSLTDDGSVMGAPTGWRLQIRDIRACAGAGFLYPLAGDFPTHPGLASTPACL